MRTFALTLILGTLIATAACRTATMYTATGVPLTTAPTAKAPTLEGVTSGIVAAGKSKGWVMDVVRPGEIVATLNNKQHVAVVTISYDTSKFSITYKDSKNLMHSGDELHRRYNGWVKHLEDAIQAEMKRQATAA